MRAIDVRVTATDDGFGPFHEAVVGTPDVSLRALHEIRLLNDGTTVMLYEYDGDESVAERIADDHFEAVDAEWQTATVDDARLMYANAEPSPLVAGLLALLDEYRVVVDWPITFRRDEVARVGLVGAESEIRAALKRVPDGVRLRVDRSGDYRPAREGLFAGLSPRERETLRTAVDLGYYRNPREANYDDLAAELDCSTGTVGEHLRNAEAAVMAAVFDGRALETTPLARPTR